MEIIFWRRADYFLEDGGLGQGLLLEGEENHHIFQRRCVLCLGLCENERKGKRPKFFSLTC